MEALNYLHDSRMSSIIGHYISHSDFVPNKCNQFHKTGFQQL